MKRKIQFGLKCVLAAALLISVSCTKLELLDATIPRYGYKQQLGVAYGELPRQTLDIYQPETKMAGLRPIIVFFYGGAWQRGSKEDYRFIGESFAKLGYVTAVADYRLYPDVSFPGFLQDSALAVKYMHSHAGEFGGDSQNLFVMGHSAGAYNAVMLAIDPQYMKAVGGDESWIRGGIGLSGPYHFLPITGEPKVPHIADIFSSAPLDVTQPVLCLTPKNHHIPSLFLGTGAEDDLVLPKNTQELADLLRLQGVEVESHVYPGLNHSDLAKLLATSFSSHGPVLADVDGFIKRTAK